MKVVINGRFLLDSYGGVRRFATELSEHVAARRDDVVIAVPPSAVDRVPHGVLHEVVGRSSGPVWEQIELPHWLRRHGRPLLLNLANIAPFTYRRQATVLHDIAPTVRPRDFTPLFLLQWHLAVRCGMLRRGQRLVTVSHASQREIADYFRTDASAIDVIYEGADSLPVPTPRVAGSSDAARFVAFGRHGAAKNTRAVIDALAVVPASVPLVVEFVGRLDPELEPYASARGIPPHRLVWSGPVSDDELAEAFAGATGFIWPSLHEGFGLPPLEAQTLGAPVIASDIPINREILADSAVYFPATDAAALAALMVGLAGDESRRSDLSDRSRRNAARFTWDATTASWSELIDRLVR